MVDENEFRITYDQINPVRCVFEKTLTSLNGKCARSSHFWLADREGYACQDEQQAARCNSLLVILREKSRFVFKMFEIDSPLPHNKEIRVQCGGLRGLAQLVDEENSNLVENISALLDRALQRYGDIEHIPFDEIMPAIAEFKARPRRRGAPKSTR